MELYFFADIPAEVAVKVAWNGYQKNKSSSWALQCQCCASHPRPPNIRKEWRVLLLYIAKGCSWVYDVWGKGCSKKQHFLEVFGVCSWAEKSIMEARLIPNYLQKAGEKPAQTVQRSRSETGVIICCSLQLQICSPIHPVSPAWEGRGWPVRRNCSKHPSPILCKRWFEPQNLSYRSLQCILRQPWSLSSLQIQDRLQVPTAVFEFCLCNNEPSSAFSSPLNSNTAKDVLTVSTLPAFFVKQCLPQGPLLMNSGALS